MDPISNAVDGLQTEVREFLSDDAARVLRLIVDPEHGSLVGKALRAEEWGLENRSPFLILETPYDNDVDAFAAMSRTLREHYAILREGIAEEGVDLEELVLELPPDMEPVAAFTTHVHRWIALTEAVLDPPLVCWVPTSFGEARSWADAAIRMVRALWDTEVRFALRDEGEGQLESSLGAASQTRTAAFELDQEETMQHFAALLGPPSAGRGPGALPGAAAPDVAPPPRPIPGPTQEQIQETREKAGLPPMPDVDQAEALRRLVLEAATAAGNSDPVALEKQAEACELCRELELRLEEVLLTMILASYLLQFGREDDALGTYQRAEALSGDWQLYPQLAQTRLALGYLHLKNKRLPEAIDVYEQAAAAAAIGEVNLLFFESLRLAGTCHVNQGTEGEAVYSWIGAVKGATRFSEAEIRNCRFGEVAASLLDLLNRRGLHDQARSTAALIEEISMTVQS
jgi:tetratricopeptide (TPR) repeat protein